MTTTVKERPILFSAPMVRAILDGRKTMTRRIVKQQPDRELDNEPYWNVGGFRASPMAANPLVCKYGRPGERLWVREAWAYFGGDEYLYQRDQSQVMFSASWETDTRIMNNAGRPVGDRKWRPSIHMPRWASRITLEITDVRVERLKDIRTEDCTAEGIEPQGNDVDTREAFFGLWSRINGPESYNENPWLWVVSFRRLEQANANH